MYWQVLVHAATRVLLLSYGGFALLHEPCILAPVAACTAIPDVALQGVQAGCDI